MSEEPVQASESLPSPVKPAARIRLWPAIVILALFWIVRIWGATAASTPLGFTIGFLLAPLVGMVALLLWWMLASRVPVKERWVVTSALVAISAVTIVIAGQDFPVIGLVLYALPVILTGWCVWMVVARNWSWPTIRYGLIMLFVIVGGTCASLRIDGMNGTFAADFNWKWSPTPEQRFQAELARSSKSPTVQPADETESAEEQAPEVEPHDWAEFRGARRDGRLTGVAVSTDWEKSPPRPLWKHLIGPGWSSLCVVGSRIFTQEQRGDDECVTCYDINTGAEKWVHKEATRFTEIVAGAGPRATPTYYHGRLYAQGANGTLSCLNAVSGQLVWKRDIAADSGAKIPQWGFSASPLIVHDQVVVWAGGPDGKSLVSYQSEDGELVWTAAQGGLSYSSPQLATLDGQEQILICTDYGVSACDPKLGTVLWEHAWQTGGVARVVQPALLGNDELLIGTGLGVGTRRLKVDRSEKGWTTEEIWTTRNFKPYFNDLVIVDEHAYGIDGNILVCVNLQDGKVTWRARGYGNGQILLLADQAILLVLSEEGEVVLVKAQPTRHEVLTRMPGVNGKTWNHPVIARQKLLIRNAEEIAVFDLSATLQPDARDPGIALAP